MLFRSVKHELPRRIPSGVTRPKGALIGLIRQPEQIKALAPPVRDAVRDSISFGISRVFLICIPLAALAWVCAVLVREIPLHAKAGLSMAIAE